MRWGVVKKNKYSQFQTSSVDNAVHPSISYHGISSFFFLHPTDIKCGKYQTWEMGEIISNVEK